MTLLHEFVAWVGAQPPRKRYDFHDTKKCALAQFARAHLNAPYVTAGVYGITMGEDALTAQTVWLFENKREHNKALSAWGDALMYSKTFGQLSKRLTPIMEKINVVS